MLRVCRPPVFSSKTCPAGYIYIVIRCRTNCGSPRPAYAASRQKPPASCVKELGPCFSGDALEKAGLAGNGLFVIFRARVRGCLMSDVASARETSAACVAYVLGANRAKCGRDGSLIVHRTRLTVENGSLQDNTVIESGSLCRVI